MRRRRGRRGGVLVLVAFALFGLMALAALTVDLGRARAVQVDLQVAADRGATANQVALAWLRQLPGRPLPILGSLRWERIEEALLGVELELDRPAWFYLSEAARGHEVA